MRALPASILIVCVIVGVCIGSLVLKHQEDVSVLKDENTRLERENAQITLEMDSINEILVSRDCTISRFKDSIDHIKPKYVIIERNYDKIDSTILAADDSTLLRIISTHKPPEGYLD